MPRAGLSTEAVVDAALQLVDRDGVQALTMATLADEVGVRSPSLYRHVDSLDDLRERCAARAVDDLAAALERATRDSTGPATVRALLTGYRTWVRAHPQRSQLVPVVAPPPTGPLTEASDRLVAVVTHAVRDLAPTYDDAIHLVRVIRSVAFGFTAIEAAGGFGLSQDVDTSFERLTAMLEQAVSAES